LWASAASVFGASVDAAVVVVVAEVPWCAGLDGLVAACAVEAFALVHAPLVLGA
jgi:single-stranded DNA-specific DHH superfamily exonuclease